MAAVLFLAPLAVLELGIGWLVMTGRLPEGPAHSEDFEVSWVNLRRAGRIDVLVLGDSIARSGIEPAVLAGEVSTATGEPATVFNMATPSAGFAISAAVVRKLVDEGRAPELVVLALTPNQLDGDETYTAFFQPSPMGWAIAGCTQAASYQAWADCAVGSISGVWRWRSEFERLLTLAAGGVQRTRESGATLRPDGFNATRGRKMAQIRRQVDRALEGRPEHVVVSESARTLFGNLVAVLRTNAIPFVLVTLPYSPPLAAALAERNPAWPDEIEAAWRDLEGAADVAIVRAPSLDELWHDGTSHDVQHLSAGGAAAFTRDLWRSAAFQGGVLDGLRVARDRRSGPALVATVP